MKSDAHTETLDQVLFHEHPAPLSIIDPVHLQLRAVNKAFTLFYGYSNTEALRLSLPDLCPGMSTGTKDSIAHLIEVCHEQQAKDGRLLKVRLSSRETLFEGRTCIVVFTQSQTIEAHETLLRTMFHQTTDAVVLIDPETGCFQDFNSIAHMGLGYTHQEFADLTFSDLQAELNKERMTELVSQVSTGAEVDFETTHYHKDGTPREIVLSMRSTIHQGRSLVSAVWRDITAQRQRERRQHYLNDRLQLYHFILSELSGAEPVTDGRVEEFCRLVTQMVGGALGIARVSVWLFDETYTRLDCIDLFESKNGRHSSGQVLNTAEFAAEFTALSNSRYVDANDAENDPRTAGYREAYLKPNGITSMLDCAIMSAGVRRGLICFEHVGRSHTWEGDEITFGCQIADQIGMVLLNRNRIETTKALQRSEAFLSRAQAVSHTGHWRLDIAHDTLEWSEETYRIFSVRPGTKLSTKDFIDCVHPEDRELVGKSWNAALNGGRYQIIHRIVAANQVKWVEARAEFERDEEGNAKVGLGVVQDITEQVQAQQALDEYRLHLEDMVASRTKELEAAKQAAEAANYAKTSFLSNMSHEIRTPMNAILGFAHLLRQDPLTERQRIRLEKLSNSGSHLLQIINDILDLSKIEANRVTIERRDFELSRTLDHIAQIVANKVAAKGLELIIDLSNTPPVLSGDSLRISQVLLNLVGNAVKFTEEGAVTVFAGTVKQEGNAVRVRFEVRDTGIGISDDAKQRLFTAFEQADTSTTRLYGGTGLGLVIAKKLTELMGGQMGVDSTVGAGSCFWFELPLLVSNTPPNNLIHGRSLSTRRVLILDPNPRTGTILQSLLQELKMPTELVDCTESAHQLLAQAEYEAKPFSLVMVDEAATDADRQSAVQSLHSLALPSAPRVVVITADETYRSNNPGAGRVQFMSKPVTSSKLHDALSRVFGLNTHTPVDHEWGSSGREVVHLRGAHVLVAEDNSINQEVTCQLLDQNGLRPRVAANGRIAVEMAKEHHFDLILMDVQMPEMDGIEATQQIRRLPGHLQTPILAMTADAFEEDRRRCLAAGMNDHIAKPVEPQVLLDTLVRWVSPGRPVLEQDSAAVPPPPLRTETEQGLPSILVQLPGIDTGAGLRLMGGKPERYMRLLRQFIAGHRQDAAELRHQLARAQLSDAREKVHALKGSAATLGLSCIAEPASALEDDLRRLTESDNSGGPVDQVLHSLLESIDAELQRVSEAVEQALSQIESSPQDSQPSNRAFSGPETEALLDELDALLSLNDSAAGELMENSPEQFKHGLGAGFAEIRRHIENFDYPDALATLRAARGTTA